jgi:hypothetical protein
LALAFRGNCNGAGAIDIVGIESRIVSAGNCRTRKRGFCCFRGDARVPNGARIQCCQANDVFRTDNQESVFDELVPSAKRGGFAEISKDTQNQEASFRWAAGEPDFIFSVSLKDPGAPSVIAESADDIFGLILVSSSPVKRMSVELSSSVGNKELGRNASIFRDILLMLPDFDDMPAWTKFG